MIRVPLVGAGFRIDIPPVTGQNCAAEMTVRKYVTAFAGIRDSYQVPLALAQSNQLDSFVTDLYLPQLPEFIAKRYTKLARRSIPGLSVWNTRSSLGVLWHSYVRWRLAPDRAAQHLRSVKWAQDELARLAGKRALQRNCDLLLYAGYALQAFEDPRLAGARKILFMYHPHILRSGEILMRDALRYPEAESSVAKVLVDSTDRSVDRELELADLVVCASEFTATTIEAIGIDRKKILIVPYGIDVPSASDLRKSEAGCHFLFVGTGLHRKGLHILCDAWRAAGLSGARLTVVARHIDPWIRVRTNVPGITIRPGVTADELETLYENANVFVLPSLVEGFGYVYLEALARGCFCIGTENTGLPDLELSADEALTVPIADTTALTNALVQAYEHWKDGRLDPARVRQSVQRWTWSRFRTAVSTCASHLSRAATL